MAHASQPKLYLLLGYPGAGKTTAAKIIAQLTGAVRLSSDEIRLSMFKQPVFSQSEHKQLYDQINNRAISLLKQGHSVIYDANLNRFIHREEKYKICRDMAIEPVLIWVQAPTPLARTRATLQASRDPNRPYGNMSQQNFDRLIKQIEPPRKNENFIIFDGTRLSDSYIAERLRLNNNA